MPIESSDDPRDVLVRKKYFSLRPQPLEQWLWRQRIAPSAERVFWLHWQEGMRNRDWCSAIPLKRAAALCALDVSSVTRAYQLLGKRGLIRRQDPGRDPARPFEQAVAITEVRVPRELLRELARYSDRSSTPVRADTTCEVPRAAAAVSPVVPGPEGLAADPFKGLKGRERQRALGALLGRLSADERRQYDQALRLHQPRLSFDEGSRLEPEERRKLLQFLQIVASKPLTATLGTVAESESSGSAQRRLTVFELARLRRDLHALTDMERAAALLREVVWAVEQGALRRFSTLHAIRIALKKIREGAWTRPNRMPPSWSRELAHSELCRSA
jgi:hypothetical protein